MDIYDSSTAIGWLFRRMARLLGVRLALARSKQQPRWQSHTSTLTQRAGKGRTIGDLARTLAAFCKSRVPSLPQRPFSALRPKTASRAPSRPTTSAPSSSPTSSSVSKWSRSRDRDGSPDTSLRRTRGESTTSGSGQVGQGRRCPDRITGRAVKVNSTGSAILRANVVALDGSASSSVCVHCRNVT